MKAVLDVVGGAILRGDHLSASAIVKGDGKTRFPVKDKDLCQSTSVGWLKAQGLFPQAQDEADDWIPDDDSGIEWWSAAAATRASRYCRDTIAMPVVIRSYIAGCSASG